MTYIESYIDNIDALEENINTLVPLLEKAISTNNSKLVKILNTNLFVTLYNFDLSILLKNYNTSTYKWERGLFIRSLASSMIEFLDDINAILGKDFRSIINEIIDDKSIFSDLNYICKEFNIIRKNNEKYFKEIRNNIHSHKDHSSYYQYYLIRNLDYEYIVEIAINLVRLITRLYRYITLLNTKYHLLEYTLTPNHRVEPTP